MSSPENHEPILLIEQTANYWSLTLNQPNKRNALSVPLVEALLEVLEKAEAANIPLLVIQGKGKNFSSGFDLSDIECLSDAELLLRFVRVETLLQRIYHSSCTTLALVHGTNMGAGVDLIASCRYRIAASGTRFCMPGLKFGLVLGTQRLKNLVGAQNALDLLHNAKLFDAEEAVKIGFINEIAPLEKWNNLIEKYQHIATTLSASSKNELYRVMNTDTRADDMARLVHSAAEPGLKNRILDYIKQR